MSYNFKRPTKNDNFYFNTTDLSIFPFKLFSTVKYPSVYGEKLKLSLLWRHSEDLLIFFLSHCFLLSIANFSVSCVIISFGK